MSTGLALIVCSCLSVAPLEDGLRISYDVTTVRLLPAVLSAASETAPATRPASTNQGSGLVRAKWVILGVGLGLFAGVGVGVSFLVIKQPHTIFSQVLTATSAFVATTSLLGLSGFIYGLSQDRYGGMLMLGVLLAMTTGVVVGALTGPVLSIPRAWRIPVTVASVVATNAFIVPLAIYVW